MSLLSILMERGGMPSANEARRLQGGGDMPPLRGFMPWSSGFEGQQKQMLQEILRAAALRDPSSQQSLKRLLPLLKM